MILGLGKSALAVVGIGFVEGWFERLAHMVFECCYMALFPQSRGRFWLTLFSALVWLQA